MKKEVNVKVLVQALIEIQTATDTSDTDFAAYLGVNRQMWRFLKRELRRPGNKTLARIQTLYPDLYSAALWVNSSTGGS
jgi:hypothetical protein